MAIDRKTFLLLATAVLAGLGYSYRFELSQALGLGSLAPNTNQTAAQGVGKKAADGKSGRSGPAAAPVTAATAVAAEMPVLLSAPGLVEPMATVAIKPRVDGQIVEVGFREGDIVKEGQMLYRLDDRLANAQIRQIEANIVRDQASLKDAELIYERREALLQKKYASEAATITARQIVAGLQASIAAGQAQLDAQKTQLDYLTLRAPLTGRTGSMSAKLGATVRTGDAPALVTINQTKPIAVSFAVPQSELVALRQALQSGAPAEITVAGTKPIKILGSLMMVDNQVDKQTGTLQGKISVQNEDEVLWPGQAVDVVLTVERRANMIAVPSSAVQPAQDGMLVWIIGPDRKVTPRTVVLDRIVGPIAYLARGLKDGEMVVTDGHLRLAPGGTVAIQEPRSGPERRPAATEKGSRS